MGYERKRGKLADLNCAAARRRGRCASRSSSARHRGAVGREVRDHARHRHAAAARLGAAVRRRDGAPAEPAAHRPRAQTASSSEGYGILQPRVAISLPAARTARGTRACCGGEPGIDPYTRAVSDVYQDVFGEGSFIGKGIYDVDAFERALERSLSREPDPEPRPARRLLRALRAAERRAAVRGVSRRATPRTSAAGTAGFAATGSSRGGCCRCVPGAGAGTRLRNPLSALSQWKLFDNLRRSLVPAALTLLLAARLDRAAARRGCGRCRSIGDPRCCPSVLRLVLDAAAQAGRSAAAAAPRRAVRSSAGRQLPQAPFDARLPALRGGRQPRRDRAHRSGGCSSRSGGCSNGARRANADRARHVRRRCARPCPVDVDRPGDRRRGGDPAGGIRRRPHWRGRADPRRCGSSSPGHRLVDQPARSRAAKRVCPSRPDALPAQARAQDLGASSRRSSARTTTGCRRTTSRSIRSPRSRIARRRRTWASRCWRT